MDLAEYAQHCVPSLTDMHRVISWTSEGLPQEREREMGIVRETYIAKNMEFGNMEYPPSAKQTDTAMTLMARDWKGWLNFGSNAVIEMRPIGGEDTKILYDEQNDILRTDGTVGTIMTDGSSPKHNNRVLDIHTLGQMDNSDGTHESANRIYDADGISPTIPTASGGGHIPKVLDVMPISERTNLDDWVWEIEGVRYLIRVRRLTPRECIRLMDFDDADADAILSINSNTQAYRQAGNSICVGVLEKCYSQLYEKKEISNA